MKKKIFLHQTANFIQGEFELTNEENASLVIIGGNRQVSPFLFNQNHLNPPNNTSNPVEDLQNIKIFNRAINNPEVKMIIGVNYGAILACGIAGGGLIQEVTNHTPPGLKEAKFGPRNYLLPSNHTQMMYLGDMERDKYELLIHSLVKSTQYKGPHKLEAAKENFLEPEYVLFKGFNKPVLAMMPDISRMRANTRTVRMTNQLINKYHDE